MNRSAVLVGAASAGVLAACVSVSGAAGTDPLSAMEAVSAVVLALWGSLFALELSRSVRLAEVVAAGATRARLSGIDVHVSGTVAMEAFVAGAIRPRIFVGATLVASLSLEELTAVLRHEEHHRSTRAPLRAAALIAWRRLARVMGLAAMFDDRLAQLEIAADLAAIEGGSTPRTLARALVKTDASRSAFGPGFATPSDRRVEALLDRAELTQAGRSLPLPLEWLALAIVTLTVACHV